MKKMFVNSENYLTNNLRSSGGKQRKEQNKNAQSN
jgi:hypothetical protein